MPHRCYAPISLHAMKLRDDNLDATDALYHKHIVHETKTLLIDLGVDKEYRLACDDEKELLRKVKRYLLYEKRSGVAHYSRLNA